MNRGVNRQTVFYGDIDRVEFGRRLADIHEVAGVETLAYCLMDNHYHLLLRSDEGNLSRAMQRLSGIYTRKTNSRLGRDGPLFRGRFHSIPVTDDQYLLAVVRYIHRNALDIPGVGSVDDYRWSSMRSVLGLRETPRFLNSEFVRGLFGHDLQRLASFHEWHDWRDVMTSTQTENNARTLSQLLQLATAHDDLRHGTDERLPQHLDRSLAVLLADGEASPLTEAATEIASFPSVAARRMALSRARRRLGGDPTLRRVLHDVTDQLGDRRAGAA
jgi:REP element-mobilizing transposase RayT